MFLNQVVFKFWYIFFISIVHAGSGMRCDSKTRASARSSSNRPQHRSSSRRNTSDTHHHSKQAPQSAEHTKQSKKGEGKQQKRRESKEEQQEQQKQGKTDDKPVDNDQLYRILGVEKDASPADIKKTYYKLAMRHHPDKGGNAEQFKEITQAYEILSDPDKRASYDKYGDSGAEQSSPNYEDVEAAFIKVVENLFGDDKDKEDKSKKAKPLVHATSVSLQQVYLGCSKKLTVIRRAFDNKFGVRRCRHCAGQGKADGDEETCSTCAGTGKYFRTAAEKVILDVDILRGIPDGYKLVYPGKGHEHPFKETGDIIVLLNVAEHPTIQRRGADLFIQHEISLHEALCGFKFDFEHLDGRKLLIKTKPEEIVAPLTQGFDPLAIEAESSKTKWELLEGYDCPSIEADGEMTSNTSKI